MNQPHPTCEAVRLITLGASVSASVMAFCLDSLDKSLIAIALSMLLLSAWGIMEHIKKYLK